MNEPKKDLLTTNRKALTINLEEARYGTIAEIGAGQEVARHFFQAGGASGTIAKTISAYDMAFSDAIYGKAPRYVSRERLLTMLDHEYRLLEERLAEARGARTAFFVFADTVATLNFKGDNEAHGWMGIRFQIHPQEPPNDILLHVRMWDKEMVLQQEALGIFGVNFIYGAFYLRTSPEKFIRSLVDNLSTDRIEVDMLKFAGPAFAQVDNRLLSLVLVQTGLTNAVMFGPDGDVLQPSEVLHKKAILVERGSFRPVTSVNVDMLSCATAQFLQEPAVKAKPVMVLMEITMNNLLASGQLDAVDFLARVDLLGAIGFTVLISNYPEFFRLTSYFRRYTKEMIGVALGINNLVAIFNERYYENLAGGILESFGRLFRNSVKLYVYPMRQQAYERYVAGDDARVAAPALASSVLISAENLQVAPHLRHLYSHLLENHFIEGLAGFNPASLDILSRDVLARIKASDASWEAMVPSAVAAKIKELGLFEYRASPSPAAVPS
ncbi:MAG TPA: TonB-dependent receptor [Opitutaceae bacterium]|nr:TonB-dependent receptor [Opitutaceae bacterium]